MSSFFLMSGAGVNVGEQVSALRSLTRPSNARTGMNFLLLDFFERQTLDSPTPEF